MLDMTTLDLVRDYEGQIALLKMRIELLEQKERELNASLRIAYGSPELMLKKMTVAGFPAIDVKDIYELLDEWHRLGGDPELLNAWREGKERWSGVDQA